MSRKIIGNTVGTPTKPKKVVDAVLADWAKQPTKPKYNASEVGADASGTATTKVSEHNTSEASHNDIRLLIEGLTNRLNTLANSDDTTLDQMSEVVAYIKSNKSLIDAITTKKVNVADIIDNLTTSVSNKPLSAKQGVALKNLIDELSEQITDYEEQLANMSVPTKTSQLQNDSNFVTSETTNKLSGDISKNTNDIVGIQAELDALTSSKAEGSTLAEQLAWLNANGDTSKEYLCVDGYYYHCVVTEGKPLYTNLLPLATDTDRKTIYNGKGYKENTRLNSSGVETTANGYETTGFIPIKAGDVLRIKGAIDGKETGAGSYTHNFCFYDSSNTFLQKIACATFNPASVSAGWYYNYAERLIQIDTSLINEKSDIVNCDSFRFMAGDFSNAIITVNEEIVEGTSEPTKVWESTGRTTPQSTNYEDRIVKLEKDVTEILEQMDDDTVEEKTYYNPNVKAIAHRGYSAVAPENTLSAFKLAKKMGFEYVECDISQTSDGVYVLLHDDTVDRTSNGTGNITSMTFEQARALDFGSWKSSAYTGEKIPTFEEFLVLCKNIGLHPYIEIKNNATFSPAQIADIVSMVKRKGMQGKVTWVSSLQTMLGYVKDADESARLCLVRTGVSENTISVAKALRNDKNEVILSVSIDGITTENIERAISNDFPVGVWTVTASQIPTLDEYITEYTSDDAIANKVLYDANI